MIIIKFLRFFRFDKNCSNKFRKELQKKNEFHRFILQIGHIKIIFFFCLKLRTHPTSSVWDELVATSILKKKVAKSVRISSRAQNKGPRLCFWLLPDGYKLSSYVVLKLCQRQTSIGCIFSRLGKRTYWKQLVLD